MPYPIGYVVMHLLAIISLKFSTLGENEHWQLLIFKLYYEKEEKALISKGPRRCKGREGSGDSYAKKSCAKLKKLSLIRSAVFFRLLIKLFTAFKSYIV